LRIYARLDAQVETHRYTTAPESRAAEVRLTALESLLKVSAAVALFLAIGFLPIGIDALVRRGAGGWEAANRGPVFLLYVFAVLCRANNRDGVVASSPDLMGDEISAPVPSQVSEVWQAERAG
jgi:hypothetical protein